MSFCTEIGGEWLHFHSCPTFFLTFLKLKIPLLFYLHTFLQTRSELLPNTLLPEIILWGAVFRGGSPWYPLLLPCTGSTPLHLVLSSTSRPAEVRLPEKGITEMPFSCILGSLERSVFCFHTWVWNTTRKIIFLQDAAGIQHLVSRVALGKFDILQFPFLCLVPGAPLWTTAESPH